MRFSRGPTNRQKRVSQGPVPNLHFNGQDEAASHFAGAKGLKMCYETHGSGRPLVLPFRMTGAAGTEYRVLPAVAGIKPNLTIKVAHHDANVRTDF